MYTLEIDPDDDDDGFRASVDCDDMDASSNPGAVEICDDGADNDCDENADGDDDECGVPDAGVADGGPGGLMDSGAERDAALGDGSMDARVDASANGGPSSLEGGCACSAGGGSAPQGMTWWFALGLIACLGWRRSKCSRSRA
ncbi:MAG: MYXO-CTERM domain-containing protein [Polyangiales bacterium]|jgi:MYXO-CTERM domain-containing protein